MIVWLIRVTVEAPLPSAGTSIGADASCALWAGPHHCQLAVKPLHRQPDRDELPLLGDLSQSQGTTAQCRVNQPGWLKPRAPSELDPAIASWQSSPCTGSLAGDGRLSLMQQADLSLATQSQEAAPQPNAGSSTHADASGPCHLQLAVEPLRGQAVISILPLQASKWHACLRLALSPRPALSTDSLQSPLRQALPHADGTQALRKCVLTACSCCLPLLHL